MFYLEKNKSRQENNTFLEFSISTRGHALDSEVRDCTCTVYTLIITLQNDLLCVELNVKPYTPTHSLTTVPWEIIKNL